MAYPPSPFKFVQAAAAALNQAVAEGYHLKGHPTRPAAVTRAKALTDHQSDSTLRIRLRTAQALGLVPEIYVLSPAESAEIERRYHASNDTDFRAWVLAGRPGRVASSPHGEIALAGLNAAPAPAAPAATAEPPTAAERREILRLNEHIRRLEHQLRGGDENAAIIEKGMSLLGLLQDNPRPPPDWLLDISHKPDAPGVPVIDFGDWHIGETVLARETFGANDFNEEIAEKRVKHLIERVLHLAFHHVATPDYSGAVLVLGGDFLSGQLHEELLATDWCPPPVAAAWCVAHLTRAIAEFTRAFGRLVVVCVPGNHGRLSRKPWAKLAATACWDHLIYKMLEQNFANVAEVTMLVPPDGEQLIQIASTRFLIMHGHELGVKGGDGIIGALGPIVRGATKVGRQQRSLGRDFDVLLLHHFHQDLWLPASGVIVNPTLKGYDEYSRAQRYRYEPAAQRLFFVHPVWGCNSPWAIYLQPPMSREPHPFVALPSAAAPIAGVL